jgi:GNAT superfamily N-acetyltransferase
MNTDTSQVVAYYASSTASVLRVIAPKKLQRNQPEEMPAILLGRLAVDVAHQRRGLGAALLKHFLLKSQEVSTSVGVRLVLVHAKNHQAVEFYQHFGFKASTIDPFTLMMRVPPISQ